MPETLCIRAPLRTKSEAISSAGDDVLECCKPPVSNTIPASRHVAKGFEIGMPANTKNRYTSSQVEDAAISRIIISPRWLLGGWWSMVAIRNGCAGAYSWRLVREKSP